MLDGNANTGVKGHQLKTPLHYAKTPSIVNFLIKNVTNGMDPYNKTLNKEYVNRSNCNIRTDVQVAKSMSLDDTLERCKCIDNSVDTLDETELKAENVGRNSKHPTDTSSNYGGRQALHNILICFFCRTILLAQFFGPVGKKSGPKKN